MECTILWCILILFETVHDLKVMSTSTRALCWGEPLSSLRVIGIVIDASMQNPRYPRQLVRRHVYGRVLERGSFGDALTHLAHLPLAHLPHARRKLWRCNHSSSRQRNGARIEHW